MADNYLEKQMEDYRAGKLASKPRVVRPAAASVRRPGDFILPFPPMNVLVLGGDISCVSEIARLFRDVDCRVALCSPDSKAFTPFAQSTGCRYYPFDPGSETKRFAVVDDLTARWGGVDVVIDLRALDGPLPDESVSPFATLLFLHSHPRFDCVSETEIRSL